MRVENPFHAGELKAHRLAGESATAVRNSFVIEDAIMPGALPFLAQQSLVVLASTSSDGGVWASPVFGAPGFVSSADGRVVHFDRARACEEKLDPLWRNLKPGEHLGLLAIEFSTRRRLRVSGLVHTVRSDGFSIEVMEAYPNCPKYIQRRNLVWDAGIAESDDFESAYGSTMTPGITELVESADTLFIASTHPEQGSDVSHRGGKPGFIRRVDPQTLRVPDYAGNSLFNTFGNLLETPRAGIAVLDFAGGRWAQITGDAVVEWNQSDEQGLTAGTGRFWTLHIRSWRILPMPSAARWHFIDSSPFNPPAR